MIDAFFLFLYISVFYEADCNKTFGHLLQLIPFFMYLLQHLLFGFKQLEEQTLSHTAMFEIEIVGVLMV